VCVVGLFVDQGWMRVVRGSDPSLVGMLLLH